MFTYSQVVGNICDLWKRGSAGHGRQRESSRGQHIPTLRERQRNSLESNTNSMLDTDSGRDIQ